MVTMVELARRGDRLTTDHLSVVVRALAASSSPSTADHEFLTYGLAAEVLRFFFGNDWTNERVFPIHNETSFHHRQGRVFLMSDSLAPADQYRHMQRVTNLAEVTFNMQGVDGQKRRISLMDKHDLESALGEMECAALLCHPKLRFRFVTPAGSRGLDYDGDVTTCAGRAVCCEIKSKCAGTAAGDQTLWHALEMSRKQLPKGQPGLVLVRIPEEWTRHQDMKAVAEKAVGRVFRQSHRVVAVIALWEEWHRTTGGWNLVMYRFKEYRNKKSRFYHPDIDDLLGLLGRANNPSWVSFHALVEEIRPRT